MDEVHVNSKLDRYGEKICKLECKFGGITQNEAHRDKKMENMRDMLRNREEREAA